MARRTCPACPRRYAGLVDVDCVVCDGVGVIALHPVALHRQDAAVVSRAVELYLEAAAREDANRLPLGDPRKTALAAAVARLRAARIIEAPLGVSEREQAHAPEGPERRIADSEAARVVSQLGGSVRPSDAANLDAAPVTYGIHDRPRASGLLPRVSAGGSPSAMAKAADPTDALGPDTRAEVYARMSLDRQAAVLAAAVDRVVATLARRGQAVGLALA